jgi:serine/threonine-protein kinase
VAPVLKGHIPHGTMGYAPPEMYKGQSEPRSDIYALGAAMFHLLTGYDPTDTPLLIFDFGKNARPCQLAPELTPQMEQLLCRAVEFKAENRFPSAQVFGEELRAHLQRLQVHTAVTLTTEPLLGPFCVRCGRKLALDDVFCQQCGQQARLLAELLVLGQGEQTAGFSVNAERETLIGRVDPQQGIYPQVDLTLHDPATSVSRRHARLFARAGQFFIEDLNSANGTFINGAQRLAPQQPQPLTNGDEIKCGDARLRFVLGAERKGG